MIAPSPTAPIGAARPIWPTTAVSTAPRIGTVILARTIGMAIFRTRAWVIAADPEPAAGTMSAIARRHEEMTGSLSEGPRAIVLPCLDMHRGVPPSRARHLRARIGIARQARAQIVDGETDCLGQARQPTAGQIVGIEPAAFDLVPEHRPAQADDRRHLEKGGGGPAMQGRQQRVADQLVLEGHDCGQLVAAPIEGNAEKADIGHATHQSPEGRVAALLDHLNRFGTGARHQEGSTVKVPVAVATGRSASSSMARARTKATERVMWKHSACARIRWPGVAGRM